MACGTGREGKGSTHLLMERSATGAARQLACFLVHASGIEAVAVGTPAAAAGPVPAAPRRPVCGKLCCHELRGRGQGSAAAGARAHNRDSAV